MELALVVAIVRVLALEAAEAKLHEMGVRGITVTKVRGYGEYANFYARDWMVDEVKIEVFAAGDQAERIAGAIWMPPTRARLVMGSWRFFPWKRC